MFATWRSRAAQTVDAKRARWGLSDASSAESDYYEELLVNPTLLTLARQRGELDCGGLRHVIVGYGNFNQVMMYSPDGGHVSVCVGLEGDPARVARMVAELLAESARGVSLATSQGLLARLGRGSADVAGPAFGEQLAVDDHVRRRENDNTSSIAISHVHCLARERSVRLNACTPR